MTYTDPTVELSLVPSVYVSQGNDPVMSRSSSVTPHISVGFGNHEVLNMWLGHRNILYIFILIII